MKWTCERGLAGSGVSAISTGVSCIDVRLTPFRIPVLMFCSVLFMCLFNFMSAHSLPFASLYASWTYPNGLCIGVPLFMSAATDVMDAPLVTLRVTASIVPLWSYVAGIPLIFSLSVFLSFSSNE